MISEAVKRVKKKSYMVMPLEGNLPAIAESARDVGRPGVSHVRMRIFLQLFH